MGRILCRNKYSFVHRFVILFTNCTFKPDYPVPCVCYLENIKSLFTVIYSDKGSMLRSAEEQAYLFFVDFLDACKGNT